MKRNLILTLLALGVVAVAVAGFTLRSNGKEAVTYEFGAIERGDLETVVTATGTLSAVETVEVGSQVSGTVAQVLADFNQPVQRGQLLAVIETDVLDAQIRDARAGLARVEAQLEEAQANLERNRPLYEAGFLAEREYMPYETAVRTNRAQVESARASLDRAVQSRRHAEIRSPIDGIVINRAVEAGQTVAASMSAPVLFHIARDLTRMEIRASVDESDIGQIRPDQPVRFTVASFPGRTFEGVTRAVRLQPEVIQNVVSYTVIIDAQNAGGRLLPGMTATIDFVVAEVQAVLLVPTNALTIEPTEEMRELLAASGGPGAASDRARGVDGGGDRAERAAVMARETGIDLSSMSREEIRAAMAQRQQRGGDRSARLALGDGGEVRPLFYRDADGRLLVAMVRLGATDGFTTEVTPVRGEIDAGNEVLVRVLGGTPVQARTPQRGGMGGTRGMRF